MRPSFLFLFACCSTSEGLTKDQLDTLQTTFSVYAGRTCPTAKKKDGNSRYLRHQVAKTINGTSYTGNGNDVNDCLHQCLIYTQINKKKRCDYVNFNFKDHGCTDKGECTPPSCYMYENQGNGCSESELKVKNGTNNGPLVNYYYVIPTPSPTVLATHYPTTTNYPNAVPTEPPSSYPTVQATETPAPTRFPTARDPTSRPTPYPVVGSVPTYPPPTPVPTETFRPTSTSKNQDESPLPPANLIVNNDITSVHIGAFLVVMALLIAVYLIVKDQEEKKRVKKKTLLGPNNNNNI